MALLLIDSLRYELGVELQKDLAKDGQVEMQAALAVLPSVTPVGIASLLPGAGQELQLLKKNGEMVAALGSQLLTNVTQRMDVLRARYGQRFAELPLTDYIREKSVLPNTVELLVLRSNTIDSHLESTPDMALRIILDSLKHIRVAIHKLKAAGFQDVVIATDHGFFLNSSAEAGDVCSKPSGTWLTIHDRSLLGDGTGDCDGPEMTDAGDLEFAVHRERFSAKVAGRDGECGERVGHVGQFADEHMNDLPFSLQRTCRQQDRGRAGSDMKTVPDGGIDNQIGDARLVFERHEGDAPGGAGSLSHQHQPRDAHELAGA